MSEGGNHGLLKLTLVEALDGLGKREFSVPELVEACLDQQEKTSSMNIYITKTQERARQEAKNSQKRWDDGSPRLLEGIPLAIKDVYCTKGIRTTAASKMLSSFVPPYESTVTQNMADAGAVCMGKTNLDEFCMGSATIPTLTGPTGNPWRPSCSAGGSSGGSAAAIAGGTALAALGTDTGGSVRQPASFCGVVGVKPTYGRCSRWGVVAFASSLDCPGPFGRTVQDAALVLQAMAGHDPKDSTSLDAPVPNYRQAVGTSVQGMRVGIPRDWYEKAHLDSQIMDLWQKGQDIFSQAGCTMVPIDLPHSVHALPCYYILACAEAASNLMRYDGVKYGHRADCAETLEELYMVTRGEGFGPEVKRRILTGTYVLSHGYYAAYYDKAQHVRAAIQKEFVDVFQKVDVILTPTAPSPAFSLDNLPTDPVQMYWNDVLTVPVNIADTCALSVPAGLSDNGLPLGLQIIAPHLHESRLFQFGSVLEASVRLPALPFLGQA
jgi:aspartyl-tRNA(Asn)/glutamyl-tRNA(Gln) amidotransferase subunit A